MDESWRNRKTLILSRTDIMGLVTPAEYVECVEQAYRMHGEGRFYMDPKGHIVLDKYPGEWEAMPSYIEEPEAAACKWVSIRERNRERFDLPTVFSILIYTHPETGFPLAICDGSYHTRHAHRRVGGGVGEMARPQGLEGARDRRRGQHGRGRDRDVQRGLRLGGGARLEPVAGDARRLRRERGPVLRFRLEPTTDLERVVRGADVVVTGTPRAARSWTTSGSRPAPTSPRSGRTRSGDQELDPRILQRARIFVDDIRQCRTDGEINVPLAEGLIGESDIAGEIGKVVTGKLAGRPADDEITVFDSTGIALQDSATVPLEYERARAAGVGVEKKMIST